METGLRTQLTGVYLFKLVYGSCQNYKIITSANDGATAVKKKKVYKLVLPSAMTSSTVTTYLPKEKTLPT